MSKKIIRAFLVIFIFFLAFTFTSCKKKSYTVTFDANGGVFSNQESIKEVTVEKKGQVAKPEDPTRENYLFKGWVLAGDELFDFNTKITKNLTILAKWEKNGSTVNTYTVTFNANGGVFKNGASTKELTVNSGDKLITPETPSKVGHTFLGWTTTSNGNEYWRFDTNFVTSNMTLYAKWAEEKAVILSVENSVIEGNQIFMLVEKDIDSVPLSDKVICSKDTTWKLYLDKMGITEITTKVATGLDGHLQNGNNNFYIVVSSLDGSQDNFYELIIHRSYEADINYYVGDQIVWQDKAYTGKEYKVEYTPTIKGYTFYNWQNQDGTIADSLTLWQDLNLFAKCEANAYEVTLDVNGGNALENSKQSIKYDTAYNLPIPTKKGYTFNGWYQDTVQVTNAEGASLNNFNYDEKVKFVASWQVNQYEITVESLDETKGEVEGSGTYDYDSTITLKATTKSGYTFVGWFKNNNKVSGELNYTFQLADDEDTTYFAKWIDFPITFEPFTGQGGKMEYQIPDTSVVGDTIDVEIIAFLGFEFDGIYKNNQLVSNDINYVFEIEEEPATYKALFKVKDEMLPFSFGCSATFCAISGFKSGFEQEEVIIPDCVTEIESGAFQWSKTIRKVVIPSSVKSIASDAFRNCENLTEVTFQDVPKQLTLGYYAFCGCPNLTTINIPSLVAWCNIIFNSSNPLENENVVLKINGVEANNITEEMFEGVTIIPRYAFMNSKIQSVAIPETVRSIGESAFEGCTSLESMVIPFTGDGGKSNTHFGYIFGARHDYSENDEYVPESLKKVTLLGLKDIEPYAFSQCTYLETIIIKDGVTRIGNEAFSSCSALQNIEIPTSVTQIDSYGISGCPSLETITLPSSIRNIESYAFYYCRSLQSIEIPSSVQSIGASAFEECTSLQSMTIPFVGEAPNGTKNMFFGYFFGASSYSYNNACVPESLKEVIITGGQKINANAFYECKSLERVEIQSGVQSIGAYAFAGCNNLKEVTIEEGVQSIGQYAFNGYDANIRALIFIPSSVTTVGQYAFSGYVFCENNTKPENWEETLGGVIYFGVTKDDIIKQNETIFLIQNESAILVKYLGNETSLDIPSTIEKDNKQYNVTTIEDNAFYHNINLNEITIPSSITSIGYGAFYGCTSLQSIKIPSSVTSIGSYAFASCTNLSDVTIEEGVQSIGSSAFSNCMSLQSLIIPSSIQTIGSSALPTIIEINITNLASWLKINFENEYANPLSNDQAVLKLNGEELINITEDMLEGVTSIANYAFYSWEKLQSIELSSNITSIGQYAFAYCTALTNITLPSSITRLEARTFYECRNLVLFVPSSVTSDGGRAFLNCAAVYFESDEEPTGYDSLSYYYNSVYFGVNENNYLEKDGIQYIIRDNQAMVTRYIGQATNLTVPSTIQIKDQVYNVTIIEHGAFADCEKLEIVELSEGITTISWCAFANCSNLKTINIPTTVVNIQTSAFASCKNLTTANFAAPYDWKVTKYNSTKDISGLSDPSTAAQYLREKYYDYVWSK